MQSQIAVLSLTAATIGVVHTTLGPDHYLPFVFMSKARKWSRTRLITITLLCGIGHVLSSIVLGLIGVFSGAGLSKLVHIEGLRGDWAAWGFTVFGFLYLLWGIFRAIRNKPHRHLHVHDGGVIHQHEHVHEKDHDHLHKNERFTNMTPWVLFLIFALGPGEPLIPLLMYPAYESGISGVVIVSAIFMLSTLISMIVLVTLLDGGLRAVQLGKLERYTHAFAGFMLFLSGVGILFLGF